MDKLLTTAMGTASTIMRAQAVNTNNLANASTDGFRAELVFITTSASGSEVSSSPDLSTGTIRSTGRSLDISLNKEGWIAVIGGDGTEAYSRRGDLHVDTVGQLTDGVGHAILGNNGPISLPPFSSIEVAGDGTISILPVGQAPSAMAVIDRIRLVAPGNDRLQRGDDGLMRLPQGEVATPDASIRVTSGSLEGSNVNAVGEMVKMIELARQFESQVQLMKSAQENSMALSKIMSMS